MKNRRKHSLCLNCHHSLQASDNYCPNCGQENTDNEISIGLLLREITSNFFSLDSRFGRTLRPFLFSPGKITNAFIEGKRVTYANPIRWYLVISLFHFFFFSWIADTQDDDQQVITFNSTDSLSTAEFDSLYYLPDSLHNDDWPMPGHYETLISHLSDQTSLSPAQIMDSLQLNELPTTRRYATRQLVKLEQESSQSISSYIIGQIPGIVFFILPLYALILKLFFWRRGRYLHHLIHSLHLHAFGFFLLGCAWVVALIVPEDDGMTNTAPIMAMFIASVYVLISFKRVYQRKWLGTIVRYMMIGFTYFFTMIICLVIGVLISLAVM